MSAVIVGSPSSGSKVLRRADFSTERNGLETLNEIYTVRTSDRRTLQPSFGTLHSAYSSASTKFARMAVENFSFREQDGDLTELNVTYVGLTTSTGLPPALVRLIPTEGAGIFGPPLTIEAEFVTDVSESEFINGSIIKNVKLAFPPQLAANLGLNQNFNKMPPFINGTKMPDNPREPYVRSGGFGLDQYLGYVTQSFSCDRRGIFLIARTTYVEASTGFRVV